MNSHSAILKFSWSFFHTMHAFRQVFPAFACGSKFLYLIARMVKYDQGVSPPSPVHGEDHLALIFGINWPICIRLWHESCITLAKYHLPQSHPAYFSCQNAARNYGISKYRMNCYLLLPNHSTTYLTYHEDNLFG